jgi:hypothetical protein
MKPPARAIVGNLIWSTDGGVWALWRIKPFDHAYGGPDQRRRTQATLRNLLVDLPPDAMLLSVCERIDPLEIVAGMAYGLDLDQFPAWEAVCESAFYWLDDVSVFRRVHYLAAALPGYGPVWREVLREAAADVGSAFGINAAPVGAKELGQRRRQAAVIENRVMRHVPVIPASAGEVCWLYARSMQREVDEPPFDGSWEPSGALVAKISEAVVKEGGYDDDKADTDGHDHLRRFVRIDGPAGSSYQSVLALTDIPLSVADGEQPLFDADAVGFPVDWCVRVRSVDAHDGVALIDPNSADRTTTVGAALAVLDSDAEEDGDEPDLQFQATALLSIAAPDLPELEEKADAITGAVEPQATGLSRPSDRQAALLRTTLPGTAVSPACRDATQFVTAGELAAAGPFCSSEVGDATGVLVGISLDGGTGTPLLYDPEANPDGSASAVLVGQPGSGRTFLLKRLCWDAVARGIQVVVIDFGDDGEFQQLAEVMPGRAQVVRFAGSAEVDPAQLDGDLVVLWAPASDGGEALAGELVALGRTVLERQPQRPGALAVDEAGSLLATPDGLRVLAGTLRQTEGAPPPTVWLSLDDPGALVSGRLVGLLGSRFVFDQAPADVGPALDLLGTAGSVDATELLAEGLGVGQCLWRDRQGRVGLVQVLPPGLPELEEAFDLGLLDEQDDDELDEEEALALTQPLGEALV